MHWKKAVALLALLLVLQNSLYSQSFNNTVELGEKNLGGPRLGLTLVHGKGELVNSLKNNQMDRLLSQFGWHFEYQVAPEQTIGPAFVVQFIPLFGGVEYGKFIPSLTTAFGIRFPSGIEFGMGPNLTVSEDEYRKMKINSSLVLAGGISIDYSGVSIPLNLAYAISPDGNRLSFVFGYALE